jgi:hypothetical protein
MLDGHTSRDVWFTLLFGDGWKEATDVKRRIYPAIFSDWCWKSYEWSRHETRLRKGSEEQTPEGVRNAERGRCRVRQTRELATLETGART